MPDLKETEQAGMSKIADYREQLQALDNWEPFLLAESRLPGRRANLELAQAVAEEGSEALFKRLISFTPQQAPTNSPEEFLAFCGVLGLGQLLARSDRSTLPLLRAFAADPRWRIREGVAMALQRWGRVNMVALLKEMSLWCQGNLLEQRAALAALCEPSLLQTHAHAVAVLTLLDQVTQNLTVVEDRQIDEFKILRKGLAYCWSVAVVAAPDPGQTMMAAWFNSPDPAVRWIMKENLKKKRLQRLDPGWVMTATKAFGP